MTNTTKFAEATIAVLNTPSEAYLYLIGFLAGKHPETLLEAVATYQAMKDAQRYAAESRCDEPCNEVH